MSLVETPIASRAPTQTRPRQVPIKNYVADFVCHAAKLVIELDGGQHFSDQAEQTDASRSAAIEAQGFKVLRFSNNDVMTNRTGVLEAIVTAIAARAPTLTLPRKRERGQTDNDATANDQARACESTDTSRGQP